MSTAYKDAPDTPDDIDKEKLIDALEAKCDHDGLSFEEWKKTLHRILPKEYRDPKPVPVPCLREISIDRRLRLMGWRLRNGYSPNHPKDSWYTVPDILGGFLLHNARNGSTYQGKRVCNG